MRIATLLLVLSALAGRLGFAQDHGHLNIGSKDGVLTFDNGIDFNAPYVKTLVFTNGGKYANVYNGNITLTALHSTNAFGEVDPAAPRAGAFVQAEIVSVQGPVGGAFSFWDSDTTTQPTVSILSGTTNAGFRFVISEAALGAGEPGGDPFGHIHGRRFTANLPGVYTVSFRAHDLSTNGVNGGPLHGSSGIQSIQFQAGVVLENPTGEQAEAILKLGATAGVSWQLQGANSLKEPQWEDLGEAVTGNDTILELPVPPAAGGNRFFRAKGVVIPP